MEKENLFEMKEGDKLKVNGMSMEIKEKVPCADTDDSFNVTDEWYEYFLSDREGQEYRLVVFLQDKPMIFQKIERKSIRNMGI